MQAILIWAIATCIIYFVTDKSDFFQELTLGWCSILAVFAVWPIVFIFQLFLAPAKIYNENTAEILSLNTKIEKIKNKEDILKKLSDFCIEGKDLYFQGFKDEKTKEKWDKNKEDWSRKVQDFIEKNINISTLHAFKNTKHCSAHFIHDNLNNHYTDQYMFDMQDFSGKIDMLDEYIQFNTSGWRNDIDD